MLLMLIISGCLTPGVEVEPELPTVPVPPVLAGSDLGLMLVYQLEYTDHLLWWSLKTLKIVDEDNEDIEWLEQYLEEYIKKEPE